MGDNSKTILAGETSVARRTALGVVVKRPIKPVLQMIPGMFLFDFLIRMAAIRKFAKYYLFPRRLALKAAQAKGQSREDRLLAAGEEVARWTAGMRLFSRDVRAAEEKLIQTLVSHYEKMLGVEGKTYEDLVRAAYLEREEYEAFLNGLYAAEAEVDRAVLTEVGERQDARTRLEAEARELKDARSKDVELIFY